MKKQIILFLIFCSALIFGQNLDFRLLHNLNKGSAPVWDKAMKDLSFTTYPLAPICAGGTLIHGYIKKDKTLIRNGYKSLITLALAMTISTGTKYLVQRQRPAAAYPNQIIQRDHSVTYSFPSGHSTAAFAAATSLTLTYRKWYVAVPAYTYASFVGYSRMRLGMHYPSDVLGGIVAGIGSGCLTWALDKAINKRKTLH